MTITTTKLISPKSDSEPRSPPQPRSPSSQRSPTPPRSPTPGEDLASSALLFLRQKDTDDLDQDSTDKKFSAPNEGVELDKSGSTVMLNLAQDDQITRDENINKMILTSYFNYAMDDRLRDSIVDQLFHGLDSLARSEIVRNLLEHMDEQALKKISKLLFSKMQMNSLANSKKRDGGFIPSSPPVKRNRLDVGKNFVAPPSPSFKRSAVLQSRVRAAGPQNSQTYRTGFGALARSYHPAPGSIASPTIPPMRKGLGQHQIRNGPSNLPFTNNWSRPTPRPPNMLASSKPGIPQSNYMGALAARIKTDGGRPRANMPVQYSPGVTPPFPCNQPALNPFSKGNLPPTLPPHYGEFLTRYPSGMGMPKAPFGNNSAGYNSQMFANFHRRTSVNGYNKGGRPPSGRFKPPAPESVLPPQPEVFICPVPDCGKLMRAKRIPYTHGNSGKSFCYIFDCCGAEYSSLRSLSSDKCLRFERLEPVPRQPARWYKQGGQWRLKCRGKVWTRCDHCNALFMHHSGKSGRHTRDKCPKYQEEQKKKNAS